MWISRGSISHSTEINEMIKLLEALIKQKLEPIETEFNEVEERIKSITTILTRDR